MSDSAQLKGIRERFLASYGLALCLLVAASLAAHIYIERTLVDEREAARMVNMSGAQRMLSQRTLALSQSLSQTPDAARADQLAMTLSRFLGAHWELRVYALTHPMAAEQRAEFETLFTAAGGLDGAVERFAALAEPAGQRPLSVEEMQALEAMAYGEMFAKLDAAVALFQRDAEEGLASIALAHMLQLAVILAVLIGEALFIFWPLMRRLVRALMMEIDARERAENALRFEQALDASKQRFISLVRTDFLAPMDRVADHLADMEAGDRAAWPSLHTAATREIDQTRKRVRSMVDYFDDWRRKFGDAGGEALSAQTPRAGGGGPGRDAA